METILNCTPHSVSVYRESDTHMDGLRRLLNDGAWPAYILMPEGPLVRAVQTTEEAAPISGIPSCKTTWGEANLPDPQPDTFLIVSALVVHAAEAAGRTTADLLTVTDTVRDRDGRVVGCVRLMRN